MFRFIVLTGLLAIVSAGTIPDGKIVGGSATTIEDHPYQVSLRVKGKHICGGSLYKEDLVVTAAHCLQGPISVEDISIRVGSTNKKHGGQVVKVKAYKNHLNYSPLSKINDVSVIRLVKNVSQSTSVRTIELATTTPKTGTSAMISGWGKKRYDDLLKPSTLFEAEVKIIDYMDCRSSKYKYGRIIDSSMLCATEESKDACQGDSGGPLVSGNKLVGIISWGKECAEAGYPGVYTDVAQFHSWIDDNAKIL